MSRNGQLVRLDVGQQDFAVTPADAREADVAWEAVRPTSPVIPSRDLSTDAIIALGELVPSSAAFAGSKAARLAEIADLPGVRTTGGFVVPFAWYERHLSSSGAADSISVLRSAAGDLTTADRHQRLALIRDKIIDAEPDRVLLDELMSRLASADAPHILRSSTNAEDLDGFNGAGLYDSIVVNDATDREEVSRALRTVWSSVWSNRGVEEREWYRIDHGQVSMAVLAQPVVPAMDAIGVAVTHNPFNSGLSGHFINVQSGSASVTDAVGDELPEQVLVHTWSDQPEIEVLTRATGKGGVALMSDSEILQLSAILREIDEKIVGPDAPSTATDVEFALGGGADRLVILQARPYRVEVAEERPPWESNATMTRRIELAVRSHGFRLAAEASVAQLALTSPRAEFSKQRRPQSSHGTVLARC